MLRFTNLPAICMLFTNLLPEELPTNDFQCRFVFNDCVSAEGGATLMTDAKLKREVLNNLVKVDLDELTTPSFTVQQQRGLTGSAENLDDFC